MRIAGAAKFAVYTVNSHGKPISRHFAQCGYIVCNFTFEIIKLTTHILIDFIEYSLNVYADGASRSARQCIE